MEHLDEADLARRVEVDDHESFRRLQLDGAGDLDLGRGGKARAIFVAAVAYRLDMQRAKLIASWHKAVTRTFDSA